MALPEVFKPLAAFLKRAEELDAAAQADPSLARAAYYCRFAAVDQGIRLVGRAPPAQAAAANAFLEQLLGRTERDKAALGITADGEAADLAQVRNFALRVFKTADDGDRAGLGSADTARSFVAAANLLDVVRNLSPGADPKLGEVAKYAKGRSVEIIKALSEGRPVPAPAGEAASFDLDAELAALGGGGGGGGAFAAAAAAPPPQQQWQQQQPGGGGAGGYGQAPARDAFDAPLPPAASGGGGGGGYGGCMDVNPSGSSSSSSALPVAMPVQLPYPPQVPPPVAYPLPPSAQQPPGGAGGAPMGDHSYYQQPPQPQPQQPQLSPQQSPPPPPQQQQQPVYSGGSAAAVPLGSHAAVAGTSRGTASFGGGGGGGGAGGRGGVPAALMSDVMGASARAGGRAGDMPAREAGVQARGGVGTAAARIDRSV